MLWLRGLIWEDLASVLVSSKRCFDPPNVGVPLRDGDSRVAFCMIPVTEVCSSGKSVSNFLLCSMKCLA